MICDSANHSFDNLQPSIFLPLLYQQTNMAKYKTAADLIRARYDTIPKNPDGGFWHKQTYPNQMWLDSIYMGEPFLVRYAALGTCGTYCSDTVYTQMLLLAQHVRDTSTGLLYHAWDDSPSMKAAWANATTGRSPSVWGRALGWYAMALVDLLPDLPAGAQHDQLLAILQGLAIGLKNTQDATTGLWYQVVDQGSKTDDWLETSGSGMFVYTLKVAVNRGYIDSSYLTVANKGWMPQLSERTYATLVDRARLRVSFGESVVIDASWSQPHSRAMADVLARSSSSELVAFRCDAPADVRTARAAERAARGN